jgi:hypothetical protein
METPVSYLGTKISDMMFMFDLIGTDKMLVYRKTDRKLLLISKFGPVISETFTGEEYTYEQFIDKAKSIFTAALNETDVTIFECKIGWS